MSTLLRFKWLDQLKKEELKLLCDNRNIDIDMSTKKGLIKLLLADKKSIKYNRLSKAKLLLEAKAKDLTIPGYNNIDNNKNQTQNLDNQDNDDKDNKDDDTEMNANPNKRLNISKDDLLELLHQNKSTKFQETKLTEMNLSELHDLCTTRKISKNDYNSKDKLIKLLTDTNADDPEYVISMTTKSLISEMKGRALKYGSSSKKDMIETLNSGITFEEQKLESVVGSDIVTSLINKTTESIKDFIEYIKDNKDDLQKITKQNVKVNNKNILNWEKSENEFRTARDAIFEIRGLMEAYTGCDFGKSENVHNNFDNPVNYDDDSDIDDVMYDDDSDEKMLHVVYQDDEDLIMNQSKKAIKNIFLKEEDAEKYRKGLVNETNDEFGIQAVMLS